MRLNVISRPEAVIMEPCDESNDNQKWNFQYLHEEKFI